MTSAVASRRRPTRVCSRHRHRARAAGAAETWYVGRTNATGRKMNIDIAIDYRRALEVSCDSLTALQRDLLVAMCVAPENEVAAGLLAPLLGLTHHGRLNLAIVGLARKLAQAADVKPPTRKDGSPRWWQIVATGREAPDGRFFWKLRPALRDAAIASCSVGGCAVPRCRGTWRD